MNDETTGLPPAARTAAHVTGRKSKPTSLVKMLQNARERAKKLRASVPRRIPVQVSIDMADHDAIAELAEKHGCKMTDVHRICLHDGLALRIAVKPISPFQSGGGVFERIPRIAKTNAAPGEAAQPEAITDELRAARARQSEELGLTGRRRDA
jgi:hypothetical protein